jgi:hypothetical protein
MNPGKAEFGRGLSFNNNFTRPDLNLITPHPENNGMCYREYIE